MKRWQLMGMLLVVAGLAGASVTEAHMKHAGTGGSQTTSGNGGVFAGGYAQGQKETGKSGTTTSAQRGKRKLWGAKGISSGQPHQ